MQLLKAIENERLIISQQLTTTEAELMKTKEQLLSISTRSGILEARLNEREKLLLLASERLKAQNERLVSLEQRVSAREGTYESLKQSFDDYSAGAETRITRLTLAVITEGIVIGGLLYALIRITAGN